MCLRELCLCRLTGSLLLESGKNPMTPTRIKPFETRKSNRKRLLFSFSADFRAFRRRQPRGWFEGDERNGNHQRIILSSKKIFENRRSSKSNMMHALMLPRRDWGRVMKYTQGKIFFREGISRDVERKNFFGEGKNLYRKKMFSEALTIVGESRLLLGRFQFSEWDGTIKCLHPCGTKSFVFVHTDGCLAEFSQLLR